MRRSLPLAVLLSLSLQPGLLRGAEPARPAPAPAVAAAVASPQTVAEAIGAVVAEGRAAVAALEARTKSAADPADALALQTAIEQAKRDLTRRLLEVQLDFARREGRLQQAAELEAILARLATPPAGEPQPRPLPPTATAGRGRGPR
ncbi:MAG: hypothetical protein ACYDIE_13640 [Candidatus Krumholzibacteriia bacterium]